MRRYRLGRIRRALVERDLAGIILYDQLNTRYAADSTNMQIWSLHNEVRYVYVPAEGPVVLFEFGGKDLLGAGIPTIDEIRALPSLSCTSGPGPGRRRRPGSGQRPWTR